MIQLKLLLVFYFILVIIHIKSKDDNILVEAGEQLSHQQENSIDNSLTEGIYKKAKKFVSDIEMVGEKIVDAIKPKVGKVNFDIDDDDVDGDDDDSIDTISEKASKKIIDGAKKVVNLVEKTGRIVIKKGTRKPLDEF
ncbi:Hypothetical protein SRAE_1000117200 [Strongyloides ratti]|uniref:Uncharacterized protein n=1 Tax=Strongyloides ratti TaxID=34506 RepID=A0A090KZE5_STRRB|nr:Hypothetical protein SRAE_1000117200 [Strongyloides ratti]CEF62905.1 Hypothetical protein SRAE_1000117200 [Strongyloides ratti]